MKRIFPALGFSLWAFMLSPALADDVPWRLEVPQSTIAVGSILNGQAGEVEQVRLLSGKVASNGAVEVHVDAQSAQSLIDIGSPDLVRGAFNLAQPTAVLRTMVDREKVDALKPGESLTMPVSGVVVLSGIPKAVSTRLRVEKQTADRVLVTSNDRATVDLDELGKSTGLGGMVEMLGLSGVKRTTTVAMNLVFERVGSD
ncbi:hypothetical protein [Aestuariispira ectoiniformans]|uniref:hypothetical protein n=1 Tax=Aestuariispira ectoiniformans TaxID=2775080 RepID=UPI00223B0033|nr:hypothetical protein [Aestuariispira ectoiniformans]